EIDVAVHSSKDLPADLPAGLALFGVLPREDPRDAVVLPAGGAHRTRPKTVGELLDLLGQTPSIGTRSVRRGAQWKRLFSGAHFKAVRGNLAAGLRKLDAGEHDALVLAAAGLKRLGFEARISFAFPVDACVPAPGQGIVAVEGRVGDDVIRDLAGRIDDAP